MDPVDPPKTLSAINSAANSVQLNWQPSTDSVRGYHVYRAGSSSGPFTRLTSSLVTGTSYSDFSATPGSYSYMVRAVKLQTTPSGTYFNPSQGIYANVNVSNTPLAIYVRVLPAPNAFVLNWNSQPGTTYRVLAKTSPDDASWIDISGSIIAPGTNCSWPDTNITLSSQRFYRVTSP
jgi:hypothetical protein